MQRDFHHGLLGSESKRSHALGWSRNRTMKNECPMCGEAMRLVARERIDHIPGTGQTSRQQVREWVCPECDYFEEVDDRSEG